jgi:HD-GYP domain-containing protein (c-di-GMP phosphodiesterase class II)
MPLTQLKVGQAIPFDIHLYFKRNGHIIVLRKQGEVITPEFVTQYKSRGIGDIWIHRDQADAYKKYISVTLEKELEKQTQLKIVNTPPPPETTLVKKPEPEKPPETNVSIHIEHPKESPPSTLPAPSLLDRRSAQIQRLLAVFMDGGLDSKKKAALTAKTARVIFKQSLEPNDLDTQTEIHSATQTLIKEIIKHLKTPSSSMIAEIWNTPEIDAELTHSSNVASYAALLALSSGLIEHDLLSDVILAGLLHDIGLSQVSSAIVSKPWKAHTAIQTELYMQHVTAALDMMNAYGPDIPERVRLLILQHHEKFNGSGYPEGLNGSQLHGNSQFIAIAETLDTIGSGQWDGTARTYSEAMTLIKTWEETSQGSMSFNPEFFGALRRWLDLST